MKHLLFVIGFTFCLAIGIYAQSGGQSNWPPAIGESSTACGASGGAVIPAASGGPAPTVKESWPMNKVVVILKEAKPYFSAYNLGQMIQEYKDCSCVITYLGGNYFRVRLGGGEIDIVVDGSI